MTTRHKLLAAATILSLGFVLATTGVSQAQQGAPCGAAMYRFDNIAPSRNDTLPSVRRQIAWLGLAAKHAGCRLRVTCALESQSAEDKQEAARVCRAARNVLLLNWQHAGNKTYNDSLLKQVGLRYVPARGNAPFGTVMVQLLP